MNTPHTPVTPVELFAARPHADDTAFGDASLAETGRRAPTLIEKYLRSPLLFWFTEALLFTPVALFLLQGLLEEVGKPGLAREINLFLFGNSHTFVGDIFGPLVLPAVGIVLALARIRDAKPGVDRKATIWMTLTGIGMVGAVLGYAFLENIGRLLR